MPCPVSFAECLAEHKLEQSGKYSSKCSTMYFCPDCKVSLKTMMQGSCRDEKNHICGESFCKNCQQYYIDDHKCYMHSMVIDEGLNMEEDEREHLELFSFDTSQSPWGKCLIFYDLKVCKRRRVNTFLIW